MNLTDTNYHYTITEKTKLIVYLILDEIKSFNLKNEHLEKKSPKSEKKKKQFYTSQLPSTMSLLK